MLEYLTWRCITLHYIHGPVAGPPHTSSVPVSTSPSTRIGSAELVAPDQLHMVHCLWHHEWDTQKNYMSYIELLPKNRSASYVGEPQSIGSNVWFHHGKRRVFVLSPSLNGHRIKHRLECGLLKYGGCQRIYTNCINLHGWKDLSAISFGSSRSSMRDR